MNDWIRMLALAPLAGALVASPVSAQDDDWDDDDPLVVLDEHLDGLDDMLDFSFGPGMHWIDDRCEEDDHCEVHVIMKNGERLVIVNGDTVKGDFPLPHMGAFTYKLGPKMGGERHRFRLDRDLIHDVHSFRDQELRKLEREAHSIARKARRAEGTERASLEEQLDRKLNEIFDYKLERQKKAVERAEEHVSEMKELQAKRKSARDKIIQNRKDELLGTEGYLEW